MIQKKQNQYTLLKQAPLKKFKGLNIGKILIK